VSPKELAMETQILGKKPRINYDKIHVSIIVFMSCQVLFLLTFSEPLSVIWGGDPLFAIYNDDIVSRTARIIMIYHSIATPFIVATTFWMMQYFDVREKWVPAMKMTLVPGAFLAGASGLIFAYTHLRFFHEVFYFGLFLVFLGGVIFMLASWPTPHKFPKNEDATEGTLFYGINLENYAMTILAFSVLVSIIYGALAAVENFTGTIWFLDRPNQDAYLAEEIVRVIFHDHPEEFIVSHLHIQLALTAAMITMIGYKVSEIKGKIYHVMLFAAPIGILTISYGAWVLNHYLIWVGAGIMILTTVALSVKGLQLISKTHLGEKHASASRWTRLKAIGTDSVGFALYFIYLYAQIVVTIAGISVGLSTRHKWRLHEWTNVEYDFNVGHWHLLSVLLATLVLLIAIKHFSEEGKLRTIAGWVIFVGGFTSFTAANFYMLRGITVEKELSMYVTFVGVWILCIGFALGIYIILKSYREKRQLLKEI
jgi:hypothetical protein